MPLSEEEQRILAEMERELHESDPGLMREVSRVGPRGDVIAPLGWSAVITFGGLGLEMLLLQTHFVLAFLGAFLMGVGIYGLEQNLKIINRSRLGQFPRVQRLETHQREPKSQTDEDNN